MMRPIVVLLLVQQVCSAVISLARLESDLTILVDDDLYDSRTTRTTTAILLGQQVSQSRAKKSCTLLHEELWSPEKQDFESGMNNSLLYQTYLGNFPTKQKFWIEGSKASCRAIDTTGQMYNVECGKKFPVLCTHSAPASTSTSSDKSSRYQVTQQVGKQKLTGYRDLLGWRFLGVRFAPQPKRFEYATLHEGTGTSSALEYGSDCIQSKDSGSEDCLFMNIWSTYLPSKRGTIKKKLKPVMVWIFGGGFTAGSPNVLQNDGGHLAARGDNVVVALNYRLSTLGFLALNDGKTNGNYWLSDLIVGLQWIQENIESFGGDPSRVTIFGESAGATAVRTLLASQKTKGLYRAAIMESSPGGFGPFNMYSHYQTVEESSAIFGASILNATDCASSASPITCLREYDPFKLVNLPIAASFPVIDGTYIKSAGLELNGKGYKANVPFLLGTNRDEGGVTAPSPTTTNVTQGIIDLNALLGIDLTSAATSGLFPASSGGDQLLNVFNATNRVLTDGGLLCSTLATAYAAANYNLAPSVYTFEFNRTYQPAGFDPRGVCNPPATTNHPNGDPDAEYYKCHAGEVYYVLGNILRDGMPDRDGHDIPFAQLTVDYWAAFARELDPNPDIGFLKARGFYGTLDQVKRSGNWREVNAKKPEMRLLQWDGGMMDFKEEKQCEILGVGRDFYEKGP